MEYMKVYTVSYPDQAQKSAAAILVAAGSYTRMGGIPKQLISLDGMPVIAHTIKAFQAAQYIQEIVLVARAEDREVFYSLCKQYAFTKVSAIVMGGKTRQESVSRGVRCVNERAGYLAIHDGARPLIRPETIDGVIEAAWHYAAAAAAVRVKDTVKIADENGFIIETPDRSRLWNVQTPQVFEHCLYLEALAEAGEKGYDFTDDCQLVEKIRQGVYLYEADYANIKITTPEDIAFAESVLRERK